MEIPLLCWDLTALREDDPKRCIAACIIVYDAAFNISFALLRSVTLSLSAWSTPQVCYLVSPSLLIANRFTFELRRKVKHHWQGVLQSRGFESTYGLLNFQLAL